jgi:hypothetical protein
MRSEDRMLSVSTRLQNHNPTLLEHENEDFEHTLALDAFAKTPRPQKHQQTATPKKPAQPSAEMNTMYQSSIKIT